MSKKFTLLISEQIGRHFIDSKYEFDHKTCDGNFITSASDGRNLQFEFTTRKNRKKVTGLKVSMETFGVKNKFHEDRSRGFVYDFFTEFERLVHEGENPTLEIHIRRNSNDEDPHIAEISILDDINLTYNIYPIGYLELCYRINGNVVINVNEDIFRHISTEEFIGPFPNADTISEVG